MTYWNNKTYKRKTRIKRIVKLVVLDILVILEIIFYNLTVSEVGRRASLLVFPR